MTVVTAETRCNGQAWMGLCFDEKKQFIIRIFSKFIQSAEEAGEKAIWFGLLNN